MTAFSKYKLIYGRFIVVLLAFLAGYSFLHWWLVLRPLIDEPSLTITHWLLPTVIAIVLYIAFLRKRFHLLKMETKPKRGQYHKRRVQRKYDSTDFSIVVIPLLAVPVIAAQFLLVDASGRLQMLSEPESINQYPAVRYYQLQNYHADLGHLYWTRFSKTTKRGAGHDVVIVVPLYGRVPTPASDTVKPTSAIWLCHSFHYITSDEDTPLQQDSLVRRFIASKVDHILLNNIEPFVYLRRPDQDEEREQYAQTIRKIGASNGQQHLLIPVNEPFSERYIMSLHATCISLVGSCLLILWLVARCIRDEDAWQQYKADIAYRTRNRLTKQ